MGSHETSSTVPRSKLYARRRLKWGAVLAILVSEIIVGAAMVFTFDLHPQVSSNTIFHAWALDGRLGLELHHDGTGLTLAQHLDTRGLEAHYTKHLARDRFRAFKPWIDWSVQKTTSERMYFVAIPLWLPVAVLVALAVRIWWLDSRRLSRWTCSHCGYRFPGIEPDRCPECGRSAGRSFLRLYRSMRR